MQFNTHGTRSDDTNTYSDSNRTGNFNDFDGWEATAKIFCWATNLARRCTVILCPAVELGGHDTSVLGKPRWGLRTDGCLRTSESTHISRYMLMILATCCCQLLQLWSLETSCVFPRVLKCLSWCQLFLNTLQPRKVATFFFFFRWRYSPLWALACRIIPLHLSLSITRSLHLLTPNTWRSLSTSSRHLFLGLPLRLVPSSSWVKIFLGILSSFILSRWALGQNRVRREVTARVE